MSLWDEAGGGSKGCKSSLWDEAGTRPRRRRTKAQREAAALAYFRKRRGGLGGFIDNFGEGLKDLAVGSAIGTVETFKAAGRDVRAQPWSLAMGPAAPLWAIGAQSGKSRVYKDIAKPIGRDYARRYGDFSLRSLY